MDIFLFDTDTIIANLYPFSQTRHCSNIRIGILTIREKWEYSGDFKVFEKMGSIDPNILKSDSAHTVQLNSNLIPTKDIIMHFKNNANALALKEIINARNGTLNYLNSPVDIFRLNDWALRKDFELITSSKKSQPLSPANSTINEPQIFLEEGAKVEHCILNASTGPIYIGKNAEIMEGSMIRGPFALCEDAIVKMGAKIYGATTIGPSCVVGGEIKNSIFFGFSNKAHDGFLGDSVIGEWCNLGAGTTNSNVKNSAGNVKIWNNKEHNFTGAGNKCGLIMGDYSKSAINTSFNTGTVVGVSSQTCTGF
jgi:UDP-N-acetylglucosamine diphosphorylase / glucose-1-phosphate thymidylyltransferase / UDP-N-acetylgalactosamine diphosphorylase / glucosamine-1-phosphate N-acetyltransferase / galactosamine-1-phosphate N-acetyltransferase